MDKNAIARMLLTGIAEQRFTIFSSEDQGARFRADEQLKLFEQAFVRLQEFINQQDALYLAHERLNTAMKDLQLPADQRSDYW
jgi:hypothetical protein